MYELDRTKWIMAFENVHIDKSRTSIPNHKAAVAAFKEGIMNAKPGNNALLIPEKTISALKTAGFSDFQSRPWLCTVDY